MTDREVEEINVLRAIVKQAEAIGVIEKRLADVTAERDALKAQLDAVKEECDASQGLLLATSAALNVMRQTAEIAARPSSLIIKRLAECEGEKYAIAAERDTLQAWLRSAPLDAIAVIAELVDQTHSGTPLARVAHAWASNKDMLRYVAMLRKTVQP